VGVAMLMRPLRDVAAFVPGHKLALFPPGAR
jgi:hypothetical protein